MGLEIERKFLVDKDKWNKSVKDKGHIFRQGYILTDPARTIRVRLTENEGFLTIKGLSVNASRSEYEYAIPKQDAKELLDNFCTSIVSKLRYFVNYQGHLWEVDEFLDDNEGLIIAEIELVNEEEAFKLPEWIGREVTTEEKYYNSNLSVNPYKNWKSR
jgi:CYTH domain-containing protein